VHHVPNAFTTGLCLSMHPELRTCFLWVVVSSTLHMHRPPAPQNWWRRRHSTSPGVRRSDPQSFSRYPAHWSCTSVALARFRTRGDALPGADVGPLVSQKPKTVLVPACRALSPDKLLFWWLGGGGLFLVMGFAFGNVAQVSCFGLRNVK